MDSYRGLLIDYAKRMGARVVVRGLRAGADFEYELQIAHANADLRPEVDTVFLPTRTNYGFISASSVREIAMHGGDIERSAPPNVCKALSSPPRWSQRALVPSVAAEMPGFTQRPATFFESEALVESLGLVHVLQSFEVDLLITIGARAVQTA